MASPDEGFTLLIVLANVAFDGADEFFHPEEGTAANTFGGDAREPAFNLIQPGRSGLTSSRRMREG